MLNRQIIYKWAISHSYDKLPEYMGCEVMMRSNAQAILANHRLRILFASECQMSIFVIFC